MPDRIGIDALPILKPGERIRAPHYETVTRAVKAQFQGGNGFADETAKLDYPKPHAVGKYTNAFAEEDVPPYSIFSIAHNDKSTDEPSRANIRKVGITSVGSPVVFYTNDSVEIPGGTWGNIRPVNFWEDTLCRYDEATGEPKVGHPCGVDFDTFQVCNHRHGFVCVQKKNENNLITIQRSREPIRVVGCVTETITAYDHCTKKLGKGKITLRFRDDKNENKFVVAAEPQDESNWEMEVWNFREKTYEANGTQISAVETLGVGLTVDYEIDNEYCKACSSSSSSSSSDDSSSGDSSSSSSSNDSSSGDSSSGNTSSGECTGFNGTIREAVGCPTREGDEMLFTFRTRTYVCGTVTDEVSETCRVYVCCGSSSGEPSSSGCTLPAAPTSVVMQWSSEASPDKVTGEINPLGDAAGPSATYRIERKYEDGIYVALTTQPGDETIIVDDGTLNQFCHYWQYRVRVENSCGVSDWTESNVIHSTCDSSSGSSSSGDCGVCAVGWKVLMEVADGTCNCSPLRDGLNHCNCYDDGTVIHWNRNFGEDGCEYTGTIDLVTATREIYYAIIDAFFNTIIYSGIAPLCPNIGDRISLTKLVDGGIAECSGWPDTVELEAIAPCQTDSSSNGGESSSGDPPTVVNGLRIDIMYVDGTGGGPVITAGAPWRDGDLMPDGITAFSGWHGKINIYNESASPVDLIDVLFSGNCIDGIIYLAGAFGTIAPGASAVIAFPWANTPSLNVLLQIGIFADTGNITIRANNVTVI